MSTNIAVLRFGDAGRHGGGVCGGSPYHRCGSQVGVTTDGMRARDALIGLCRAGLDAWTLRARALDRLQAAVPFECAWWATADPATLLFTGGFSKDIPSQATSLFLANELLENDVNKFSDLAVDGSVATTLYAATQNDPERSSRYRTILHPFGMGDELRIALVEDGLCWGYMCLHRSRGAAFDPQEVAFLRSLGPQLAGGLRNALLLAVAGSHSASESPGIVMLSEDLAVVSATSNAGEWLEEMADTPAGTAPAQAVRAVAARLLAQEHGEPWAGAETPRVRVRTRAGRWLTAHALRLSGAAHSGEIAVVLELARPEEMAPLLLSAYALTERERTVAQCVLRGMSNKLIGRRLCVSPLTVQQHLKAVFEKIGVHSRGELMARVLAEFRNLKA